MKIFFRRCRWVLLPALAVFLSGCGREDVREFRSLDTAMGTVIQQTIYATEAGTYTEDILVMLKCLEEETLSWRLKSSEVSQVNQNAGSGNWMELSAKLTQVLKLCMELAEGTDGAFDVTLGPVARLWDIDSWAMGSRTGTFEAPEAEVLGRTLAQCGPERVDFRMPQEDECGLVRLEEGAALDLGAVGKGFALDEICSYLEAQPGVAGAVVSVGGSVLTYGQKPDGTAWAVGIADPHDPSSNLGVLTLAGQWYISTSGDYERYVEAGGIRYHHILDPSTGYPADSGLDSVTILAPSGLLSDALSTACFVLGREQGLLLAQRYGAEALFVEKDGGIFMTPGMEEVFRPAN